MEGYGLRLKPPGVKWPTRGQKPTDGEKPAEKAAYPAEQIPAQVKAQPQVQAGGFAYSQVRLLDGEQEVERMGNEKRSLILTNKRIIYISRERHTSRAAVAFLQDIVTARVKRSRPNKMFPVAGILLAMVALIWSLFSGLGGDFNSPTTAVVLIGDMILVLGCLILYLSSASAIIVFKTANDVIAFSLGPEDNMYRFINRWLELKDRLG
jgi:hypothetical protein